MIEWFDPEEKLPEDQQECLLMPHYQDGLVTVGVYGPIAWDTKMDAWCDLFRSSEAGEIVAKGSIGCWTPWEPIAPPDHLPTPWPEKAAEK